jgi:hypothetical protein
MNTSDWKYKILDNWVFNIQDFVDYYTTVKNNFQHLEFSKDVMTDIDWLYAQEKMEGYHAWSALTRYKDPTLPCPLYRGDVTPFEIVQDDLFNNPTELVFGIVKKIIDTVPGVFQIGLACHDPGFVIVPHSDVTIPDKADFKIHIPILTNTDANWYFEEELLNLQVGKAYLLNSSYTHSTANYGDTRRVHLMMSIRNECVEEVLTKTFNLT